MLEPQPQSYGLKADALPLLRSLSEAEPGTRWLEALCHHLPNDGIGELVGAILFWMLLWPFFLIGLLLSPIIRLLPERDAAILAYRRYLADLNVFIRKQHDFWLQLDGRSLEVEVAELLVSRGHRVVLTGGAGDGGVDLVVDNATIIQCKAHCKPIGPSAVRDLLGAKHDTRTSRAVLISTRGFTRASREFARRNGIELWDVDKLLQLRCQSQEKVRTA